MVEWENDLKKVIDILANNPQLWICGNPALKYVNIRIDTRDGAFYLSDRDGKTITSKDVFAAKEMLDSRKAEWNV